MTSTNEMNDEDTASDLEVLGTEEMVRKYILGKGYNVEPTFMINQVTWLFFFITKGNMC